MMVALLMGWGEVSRFLHFYPEGQNIRAYTDSKVNMQVRNALLRLARATFVMVQRPDSFPASSHEVKEKEGFVG